VDRGEIINCNWLSDKVAIHLPGIFVNSDYSYYENNLTSFLFNEQYNLLDYKKNKSINAPLFISFLLLGIKLPFTENLNSADHYFNKAFLFASSKDDTLAIYRVKAVTESDPEKKEFYCKEILKENPLDSLILFYK
jgi:hypothetical protein